LVGDRLRLVYDQRRRLPARLPGTNRRLEAAEQRRLGSLRAAGETEPRREGLEELGARQGRVVDQRAPHVAASVGGQRGAEQRRLAGTGLTDQQRHRFGRRQSVFEVAQRLTVLRREEQVLRIRRQLEWTFPETVVARVHEMLAARQGTRTIVLTNFTGTPSLRAGWYRQRLAVRTTSESKLVFNDRRTVASTPRPDSSMPMSTMPVPSPHPPLPSTSPPLSA